MTAPIHRSVLLLHLDYTAWATGLLLKAATDLTSEELAAERGVSHGGILDTLRHIYYADRVWLSRLQGENRAFKDSAEPSLEDLQSAWPTLLARFREFVAGMPEDDLAGTLHYTNIKGDAKSDIRWQILLHVVNHGTLHRGQVMAMIRQLGYTPPPTDLIFYYQQL